MTNPLTKGAYQTALTRGWIGVPPEWRRRDAPAPEIASERNRRDFALNFFEELRARSAAAGGPPPLGLHLLIGKTTPEKVKNMIANVSHGLIAPVELIARKL